MKRAHYTKFAGRLLALAMCLALLAGLLPALMSVARAEETGTVTVTMGTYGQLPANTSVKLVLYRIGDADPSAASGWRVNDDLADYGVLSAQTSSELGEVAEKILKKIKGKYSGTEMALDSTGTCVFTGLEAGIYLGALSKGPDGLEVTPFIVTVPTVDETTHKVIYEYDVNTKSEFNPTPTPSPEPTPEATPTPTTDVNGQKVWDDQSNAHKTRPSSITVQLYGNGVLVNVEPEWTGTDGDNWSYAFTGLPVYDDTGAEITYTVQESPVSGYESSVSGTTITNKLIPHDTEEFTDISGSKTWNDKGDDKRPSYITVHLLRDGEAVEERKVTAADNWSYTFEHMPVDDGYGNKYVYTVREDAVAGYFARTDGYNLINTKLPDEPETPPDEPQTPNSPPPFDEKTEEELEDLVDLFDYDTPLWGGLLGTGDDLPIYPFIFGGVGLLAVALLVILGVKRRKSGASK